MGNPFDYNGDGRWSTSERAFTHYGVGPAMRGGGGNAGGSSGCGGFGCGCLSVLLGIVIALAIIYSYYD